MSFEISLDEKMTVACPSGHRIRGDRSLSGSRIRCPRCAAEFLFAEVPESAGETTVSDTAVMRILGDIPAPSVPEATLEETRTCPRCQVSMSMNAAVCEHCNCYVGVMPTFMQKLTSENLPPAHPS